MGDILVVASTKGGSGKSTLVTNLAVIRAAAGKKVLVIDGDKQESALSFAQLRENSLGSTGFAAVSLRNKQLRAQGAARAAKFDNTIIDVGGHDNLSLRASLLIANMVLIPVQPRTYDALAFSQMLALIEKSRAGNPNQLRVMAVLNMADPVGKDNEDTLDFLMGIKDVEVLGVIGRRKAFSNSVPTGRAVTEYQPRDNKAIDEINALAAGIYQDQVKGKN